MNNNINFSVLCKHWKIILGFLFLFLSSDLKAFHLVGGNLGYTYIGADTNTPGNSLITITLDAYMDCLASTWLNGSFPEPVIRIGIYEGVFAPTTPLNNTQSFGLFLDSVIAVDPNLPVVCDSFNLLSNVCVKLVRYESTISLPTSTLGYWLIYDRCCRRGGILNLSNSANQSFAYTTWIPADSSGIIINSSPQFTDTLVSYLCTTDTAYIPNSAVDPDGDSLVYALQTPYNGVTGNGNPAYIPYNTALMNPYSFPPIDAFYQTGFNLTNLLGPGGWSSVNPSTGLTRFLTNSTGVYVASVEIHEYRNGNLLSVTRRNMQLIADNCPNNNMPIQDISNLDPSSTSPLTYEVEEGDTICFDLQYNDLDGDPLKFEASSDIFNSALTNPVATVTSPVNGIGSVTGTICWNTSCSQGRATPYVVDVIVTDSNCPPLPLPQQVNIKVIPYLGPQNIYGDSVDCLTNSPSNYSTDILPNISYNWITNGGVITSGNGTPNIIVNWNTGIASGIISLVTSNARGCFSDTITRVIILSDVIADAGVDTSACLGNPIQLGGNPTTSNPNNSILWTPSAGLNDPTLANPMANPAVTTTYIVSLTDTRGCLGTDTVVVTVNQLIPSGILSDYFLCPGDTLQVNAAGNTFLWGPNLFISAINIPNPQIYAPTDQTYSLNYFDVNGCEGNDTTVITVNATIPTDAGLDAPVCEGDSFLLGGNPTGPFGTTYLWSPTTNMNNNTFANPSVLPLATTSYIVITSNDTCTGTDTVLVTVNPVPSLTMPADTYVCAGDSTQLLAIGTGAFAWNNGTTLSDTNIANPIAFPTLGTFYTVTLTDAKSCESIDSVFVDNQPLPIVSAGGIVNACKFLPTPIGGNPTGPIGATYLWTPATGLNFNGLANPLVTIDKDAFYSVKVTDSLGCTGFDTVRVKVFRLSGFGDTTVCNNEKLRLSTQTTHGIAPFTYQWDNGNLLSDSTSSSPFVIAGSQSDFNVTVTDANNCNDTVKFTLNLFASSKSEFTYDILPTCEGVGVQVTDISSGAAAYEWLINGILVSEEQNPLVVFEYDKNATISLITTSADGCKDTTQVTVVGPKFEDIAAIKISNVFTPNGDGENDFFEITSNGNLSSCVELTVFNRNGAVAHQSSGGIHLWDGRSSTGQKYPDGVYYYVYDINGKEFHGNVTLLR